MKYFVFLMPLVLAMSFNINAADTDQNEVDYVAFCNEQADLAGIIDADEKKEFVNICLTNYGITPLE